MTFRPKKVGEPPHPAKAIIRNTLITAVTFPAWIVMEVMPEVFASRYNPDRWFIRAPWRLTNPSLSIAMVLGFAMWLGIAYGSL